MAVPYPVLNISVALYESTLQHVTKFVVNLHPTKHYMKNFYFTDGELIQVHIQQFAKGCLSNQSIYSFLSHQQNCNYGLYHKLFLVVSDFISTLKKMAEITMGLEEMVITFIVPNIIKVGDFIHAAIYFPSASNFSCSWTIYTPLNNYSRPGR